MHTTPIMASDNEGDTMDEVVGFNDPCILGIDEAGRGPVLGPMVYAAAVCPVSRKDDLKNLGVDDSKALKPEERAALRAKLMKAPFVRTFEEAMPADTLSEQMLAKHRHNLNQIAHDAALRLVEQAIAAGCNITEVYADTVGPPHSYADKFRKAFPSLSKVDVRKKADSIFPVVSAASIVAKTTRDHDLECWECKLDLPLPAARGSGYPGDDVTKKWLRGSLDPVFGFPDLVRFSWGTSKTMLKERGVEIEWYVANRSTFFARTFCDELTIFVQVRARREQ